jgi:tRNA(Ile)-lysidine synthase
MKRDSPCMMASTVASTLKKTTELNPLFNALDALSQQLLTQFTQGLKTGGLQYRGRNLRLAIAYSGGVDSTALLQLTCLFRDVYGATLMAVYYDHGWRGSPPPELPRLQKNCLRLRVPLVVVPPCAGLTQSEESARIHRYDKLLSVAQQFKADALVTGHHEGDQIETLLFRLLRGTGLEGLGGIQPRMHFDSVQVPATDLVALKKATIPVVRPLLNTTKPQLETFCTTHELQTFTDPTNSSSKYARNAIRKELVPLLETLMPQFRQALLRLSDLSRSDTEILKRVDEQQWQQLMLPTATKTFHQLGDSLNLSYFCQLNTAYQRRLLYKFLSLWHIEPSYQLVQQLLDFLTATPSKKRPLQRWSLGVLHQSNPAEAAGVSRRFLVRSATAFWVELLPPQAIDSPQLLEALPAPILGGLISLPWNEMKGVRMMPWPKRAGLFDVRQLPQPKALEVYVNIQGFEGQALVARTRRAGDWITPLGMAGKRMKLKDYFIQQGIAQPLRKTWVLIAVEATGEVLWVPEVGISQALQVSPKRPPSHSWMIGDMVDLEQLKTLKFLFEDLSNAATAEIAEQAENAEATVQTDDDDDDADTLTVKAGEEAHREEAFSAIKAPYQETKPKPWLKNESTLEAEARAFLEEEAENIPANEADFVERRTNPNRYGKLDEASFELDDIDE